MKDLAAGERLGRKFTCTLFIPHGRGLNRCYVKFEPIEIKTSFWCVYSTNHTLSNDTKVNDFVTLTLTFALKIVVWTLLPPGYSISQIHFVSLVFF